MKEQPNNHAQLDPAALYVMRVQLLSHQVWLLADGANLLQGEKGETLKSVTARWSAWFGKNKDVHKVKGNLSREHAVAFVGRLTAAAMLQPAITLFCKKGGAA